MVTTDPIPLIFQMDDRFVFTGSELTKLFFDMAYIGNLIDHVRNDSKDEKVLGHIEGINDLLSMIREEICDIIRETKEGDR